MLVILIVVASGCAGLKDDEHLRAVLLVETCQDFVDELQKEAESPSAQADLLRPVSGTISWIDLQGIRTISPSFVLDALHSRPGQTIDPEVVREDLRRLWNLEVFSDVRAEVEESPLGLGLILRFSVTERPLIGRVIVAGTMRASRSLDRLLLLEGGIFDPYRIHRQLNVTTRLLRLDGYLRAAIHSKLRQDDSGRIDLCFEVKTGPLFLIEEISFVGNEELSTGSLHDALTTGDGRFNLPGLPYRQEVLSGDLEKLEAMYLDQGIIEVYLGPIEEDIDERTNRIFIRIPIREGRQHRISDVRVQGDLGADPKELQDAITIEPGDVFSKSEVTRTMNRLRILSIRSGRPMKIDVQSQLYEDSALVDLVFEARPE
jgi:outer membrane protein insertion porin family